MFSIRCKVEWIAVFSIPFLHEIIIEPVYLAVDRLNLNMHE